ncbi:MAG TPA: hypothetical protein VIF61_12675 [Methylocystis sp.]|jgi:hypothetical protein
MMLDTTAATPTKTIPEPPFIIELANNPMGDIEQFGALAAEGSAIAAVLPSNVSLAPQ